MTSTKPPIRASDPEHQRLLRAAASGDIQTLTQASDSLLHKAVCQSGCTVLHWAAGANRVDVLHYLLQKRSGLFSPEIETRPVPGKSRRHQQRRTPLHYACRNGCLQAAQALVNDYGADPNPSTRDAATTTPFALAVWQNHLPVCRWLVEECGTVAAQQVNVFGCSPIHWIGSAPVHRANLDDNDDDEDGSALIPLAEWLTKQPGMDLQLRQRHGHSALHKAAWGGHFDLAQYWHQRHDLWDDQPDHAGNYAADLADMAATPRHARVATYLRHHCSRQRAWSCQVLQLPCSPLADLSFRDIRQAYLAAVRRVHPDRIRQRDQEEPEETKNESKCNVDHEFDTVCKAYQHLTVHGGRGSQSNPSHSLPLLLLNDKKDADSDRPDPLSLPVVMEEQVSCFKARLIAVIREHGGKGLDLSNLKKKWKQVWPDTPFPDPAVDRSNNSNRKTSLSDWIRQSAGDVVTLEFDDHNSHCLRLYVKPHSSRSR